GVPLGPGDVAMLNGPFAGGTHLPDVTVVAPVFLRGRRRPFAYVANRAHHADIGGMAPGSMPLATEIYQEGLRLPPVRLIAAGRPQPDVLAIFLANTRVRAEREGDLMAQWAALRVGADRRARRLDRPRPLPGGGGGGQRGDLAAHRGCGPPRAGAGTAGAYPCGERRDDEQPGVRRHVRRARVLVLRDDRGRSRRGTRGTGRVGRSHAHDQHDDDARRGPRGLLPAARPAPGGAARLGGPRAPPRGRRDRTRDRVPRAGRGDAPRRAPPRRALWTRRR